MYLGKIVEMESVDDIMEKPIHPYTQALLSNVPIPDPTIKRRKIMIKGENPDPINLPSGCRFHPRCPYARPVCGEKEPPLIEVEKGHYVACHFPIK